MVGLVGRGDENCPVHQAVVFLVRRECLSLRHTQLSLACDSCCRCDAEKLMDERWRDDFDVIIDERSAG